jgi:hypothetical protein
MKVPGPGLETLPGCLRQAHLGWRNPPLIIFGHGSGDQRNWPFLDDHASA